MEFEQVNIGFLLGLVGLIVIGLALVLTHQDGTLLKICLVLIGIAMGLPLQLPEMFKSKTE